MDGRDPQGRTAQTAGADRPARRAACSACRRRTAACASSRSRWRANAPQLLSKNEQARTPGGSDDRAAEVAGAAHMSRAGHRPHPRPRIHRRRERRGARQPGLGGAHAGRASMRELRGGNRMAALDRVAVLTALNLAHELQQLRDEDRRTASGATRDALRRTRRGQSPARRAARAQAEPAAAYSAAERNCDCRARERAILAASSAVSDGVRKHSPCPLMTTTGTQR